MLSSVVGMVVLLGGLIFFHELGHYLIAKLFKIKVEVFSLGFGKKILKKTYGETEYAISIIPLGGYVKLMGDDPYKAVPVEDAARAFSTQRLYKRFLVVAAGPIANLLLAFVLVLFVLWYGEPVAGTKIGTVIPQSPAWDAGFRAEDRILAVDEKAVTRWEQVGEELKDRAGERVAFRVERASQELMIAYEVVKMRVKNFVGQEEEIGGLKGAIEYPFEPLVGVSNPKSPAYVAGIRTGDLITKIESTPIRVFDDIHRALAQAWAPERVVTLVTQRGEQQREHIHTVTLPKGPVAADSGLLGIGSLLGLFPSELFVRALTPGSPAEVGGLLVGDRITKIGTRSIYSFDSVVDEVQNNSASGVALVFEVEREGRLLTMPLKPAETQLTDPITQEKYKKYLVGLAPQVAYHEPEIVIFRVREWGPLWAHAYADTYDLAKKTVISIGMLVTGQVSVKNLGGPLLIASVAGKSLDIGLAAFLKTMALISINLFLLNLLPVPVLDGGHLFFYVIELFKGKPVSIRTMEIATQFGMALILMLVGLTLFNDVYRLVSH